MDNFKLFHIDALTNMHVGSGNITYGFVDNLIQRNAVTGFPVIHASGIKGALREYFNNLNGNKVDLLRQTCLLCR